MKEEDGQEQEEGSANGNGCGSESGYVLYPFLSPLLLLHLLPSPPSASSSWTPAEERRRWGRRREGGREGRGADGGGGGGGGGGRRKRRKRDVQASRAVDAGLEKKEGRIHQRLLHSSSSPSLPPSLHPSLLEEGRRRHGRRLAGEEKKMRTTKEQEEEEEEEEEEEQKQKMAGMQAEKGTRKTHVPAPRHQGRRGLLLQQLRSPSAPLSPPVLFLGQIARWPPRGLFPLPSGQRRREGGREG